LSATRRIEDDRLEGTGRSARADELVVEEPLEIRIAGEPVATTMRTPGHDRELVLGFLWSEGMIRTLADVGSIAPCGRTGDPGRENTIEVTPGPGAVLPEREPASRRGTITTSACGVCGRRTIDDLLARCAPLEGRARVSRDVILAAMREQRAHQPVFARTGGSHAASLFTLEGEHLASFEDVGRHNATDKLVGHMLLAGALPLREHMLVVSGRASFEIVQKAIAAGIPVVVSVSAASSLAVELAERARVVLAGFARGDSLVVYSGRERVG
jgi:FdhD protein